jgi:hypothetical protein
MMSFVYLCFLVKFKSGPPASFNATLGGSMLAHITNGNVPVIQRILRLS